MSEKQDPETLQEALEALEPGKMFTLSPLNGVSPELDRMLRIIAAAQGISVAALRRNLLTDGCRRAWNGEPIHITLEAPVPTKTEAPE